MTIPAIRQYEACGFLLKADGLAENGQVYGRDTLERLRSIASFRATGTGSNEINTLASHIYGRAPIRYVERPEFETAAREAMVQLKQLQLALIALSKANSLCGPDHCCISEGGCIIPNSLHAHSSV